MSFHRSLVIKNGHPFGQPHDPYIINQKIERCNPQWRQKFVLKTAAS